jgi:hypothetical protein
VALAVKNQEITVMNQTVYHRRRHLPVVENTDPSA